MRTHRQQVDAAAGLRDIDSRRGVDGQPLSAKELFGDDVYTTRDCWEVLDRDDVDAGTSPRVAATSSSFTNQASRAPGTITRPSASPNRC